MAKEQIGKLHYNTDIERREELWKLRQTFLANKHRVAAQKNVGSDYSENEDPSRNACG
jgi:hypothetical protein